MALSTTLGLARSVRLCPRALTHCWGFTTATQDDVKSGQVATRTEGKSPRHAPPSGTLAAPSLIDLPFRRMSDMMSQMQREMDQVLGNFGALNPFALMDTLGRELPPAPLATRRLVPLEVQEDDKAYTVRAELPGFTKDDIKVTLDPVSGALTLTGQRSTGSSEDEAGKQGGGYRSSMFFQRTLTLPQDVDLDKPITGKTEHGVLTLVLPKGAVKSHIKEIPVE